jgi:pimeloyl-ACP methyl ester carboxylesterase
MMADRSHGLVDVNGITVHYVEQGEGPLVVFCHGFPESWYSWRHQLDAVASAGYRGVALDMREACARAGIDAITPYELRHTAITHQIESGRSATQVADWAGTSERMIYKHYRHKLREIVEVDPLDYS